MTQFEDAKCVGQWFLFESTHMSDHVEARELCETCPVRDACEGLLQEVLKDTAGVIRQGGGPQGTWAGKLYSIGGRVASCGTDAGYRSHIKHKTPPCASCSGAHSKALKDYYERKRAAATTPEHCGLPLGGTDGGYYHHVRVKKQKACNACKQAHAAYESKRYHRAKKAS